MWQFIAENFNEFLTYTGFANATAGNLIMILVPVWRLASMRTTQYSTSSIKVCARDGTRRLSSSASVP